MTDKLTTGFDLKSVNDEGYFEGYASIFDVVDQGRDIVERGAFKRTIADRGAAGIKMLWQHDPTEPIGVLDEIYEDSHGLYVKGRLLMDVKRAHEAHALMVEGALDGLSIGFKTVRAKRDTEKGLRHLLDLDLWEVSLVTFPMQPSARVRQFKAAANKTIRDYEAFLREAGGFSRNEAKVLATKGFQGFRDEREAQTPWEPTLASINSLIGQLKS
jgi:hypothetical protein